MKLSSNSRQTATGPTLAPASTAPNTATATTGLGNTEIEQNGAGQAQVNELSARERASRRQEVMWKITEVKKFAGCHRWKRGGEVGLSWSPQGASDFVGLQNTHSRWGSPLAEVEVMGDRRIELAIAAKNHMSSAEGAGMAMFVGTVRHNREQSFKQVEAGVKSAHAAMTNTSMWRKEKQRYGIAHVYFDYEITWSPVNGWHIHKNALLFLDRELSTVELDALGDGMFSRWSAGAVKAGMDAPIRERGVTLSQVSGWGADTAKMATYLAKGMAQEFTGSATKSGHGQSLTPFQMLDVLGENLAAGVPMDARLLAAYGEYETGSENLRSSWSRGAKKALGIDYLTAEQRREMEVELFALADLEAPQRPSEQGRIMVAAIGDNWSVIQSDLGVRQSILDAVKREKTAEAAQTTALLLLAEHGVMAKPCMVAMDGVDLDEVLPSRTQAFARDLGVAVWTGQEQRLVPLGV